VLGEHRGRQGHPAPCGGLAFAPDSRHLAVGLGLGPVYVVRLGGPPKPEE
jgi:hypothetical protein